MGAKEIVERFAIPRHVLYRLVNSGAIPAHEAPREFWHQRRRLLFDPDEVAAAIARLGGKLPE